WSPPWWMADAQGVCHGAGVPTGARSRRSGTHLCVQFLSTWRQRFVPGAERAIDLSEVLSPQLRRRCPRIDGGRRRPGLRRRRPSRSYARGGHLTLPTTYRARGAARTMHVERLVKTMRPAQPSLRVYWELTRACDLACRHCRAEAQPSRSADELTTAECVDVLRDLAAAGSPFPHVIFTGGDPLKRPDLFDLVREGVRFGLGVSVAPSATMSLTRETVLGLK